MTDAAAPPVPTAPEPAPDENVTRGALVAVLAIPAAILGFVAVAWVFSAAGGEFPVLVIALAFLVPTVTAWLYTKGAGAKPGT